MIFLLKNLNITILSNFKDFLSKSRQNHDQLSKKLSLGMYEIIHVLK